MVSLPRFTDFPEGKVVLVRALGEWARDALAWMRSIPVVELVESEYLGGASITLRTARTTPPFAVLAVRAAAIDTPGVYAVTTPVVVWEWRPDAAGQGQIAVTAVTGPTSGVRYRVRFVIFSAREA